MQISNESSYRPMEFHEFELSLDSSEELVPIVKIFDRFNFHNTPIFWLRLVCMASICADLVNRLGEKIGFNNQKIRTQELLSKSKHPFVDAHIDDYKALFSTILDEGL